MRDLLILGYHAVSDEWPADLSTTPDRLERQLRLLLGRGYRPTTFSAAVAEPPSARTLAVTFDDAFSSVYELGFPILAALGVPATVFVPTSFPDAEPPMSWPGIDRWLAGPHEAELRCASWQQLGELDQAGWEIGSHTHSHPRLPALDDLALAEELEQSRAICETRLGKRCRSLAYPYGCHDRRVVAAVEQAGYAAAAIMDARVRHPPPLRWPRVGVYRVDDQRRFRLKVSPLVRRLRALRSLPLASGGDG